MEHLPKALVEVQKEITNAPANSKNPFFNSNYTDLATAVNHCRPLLAKHGLAITQILTNVDGQPALKNTIWHESGEHICESFPLNLPADPQKAGSYITYMRRYSYLGLSCIAPEDDDGNKASGNSKTDKKPPQKPQEQAPETLSPNQKKALEAKIKESTLDREKVKKHLEVKSLNDLTKKKASYTLDNWESFVNYYQQQEEA